MAGRTTVNLDNDVKDVLGRSTVDGMCLKLPRADTDTGMMPRELYARVDQALKALGGKWNRGKGGHVFDYDPRELIAQGVDTGKVRHLKNEFQFFETPAALARELVELAKIDDGQQILEPSAGRGALIRAMHEDIAGFLVTAVEIDPRHVEALTKTGAQVHCADFLTWKNEIQFDRIIANPPFSKGQDVAHVTRMYEVAAPGGVVVSIMSPNAHEKDDRKGRAFRELLDAHGEVVMDVPAGTFSDSGTDVPAIVVRLMKPAG